MLNFKKRYLFLALGISFFAGATIAQTLSFPDVPEKSWFYPYVMEIKDWGIVAGNDDGTFAPSRNINRAEFAKMLSLYDQRIDKKINMALENIKTPSTENNSPTISGNNLPAVMYIEKYNGDSEPCPSGWEEQSYAVIWEDGKNKKTRERVCTTSNYCHVLYLGNDNGEAKACPQPWQEAGNGLIADKNYRRTCYVCE